MHMKYLQALAEINNHYEEILNIIDGEASFHLLLKTWNIDPSEKANLVEEREVLRYLISCQNMIAFDQNAKRPDIEVVNRCFNRYLKFLEKIHGCHAYNVNQHRSKLIQKRYKACRHYLFKFSLPGWVRNMPEEVLTLENLYPEFY